MGLARPEIAISVFVLLSTGFCLGQSLGDIARQERERRSKLPKHAAVITNEDLKKDKIFSAPADMEQVATSNAADTTPQVTTAPAANVPLWGVAEQAGFSLGAYARTLREERQRRERQTELAQKPETPAATMPVAIPERKQSPARRQHQASQGEPFPATPQPRAAQQTGPPLIRVERGDSLWRLARRHYGAGILWRLLWEANPEIRRPNLLSVGLMLRQPSDELLALYNGGKSTSRVEAARVNHRGNVRRPQRYTRTQTTIVHGSASKKLIALRAARHLDAPPSLRRPVFTPIGQ
jgi:hypothetical protein